MKEPMATKGRQKMGDETFTEAINDLIGPPVPRSMEEINEVLNKLWDQIWYSRSVMFQHSDRSMSEGLKDLAAEGRRKVEEKYPGELGPWTDYEWGEISGKMMAIRWMLGEEWETTLDT